MDRLREKDRSIDSFREREALRDLVGKSISKRKILKIKIYYKLKVQFTQFHAVIDKTKIFRCT